MWKVITIRVNYYTEREILMWIRDMDALMKMLDLMKIDACLSRNMNGE